MKTTKQQQKEKALELMAELDIYKPYINGFKAAKQRVCFFEGYAGFWAEQEPEIQNKIKELENKYNCTVYAITHTLSDDIGEMYEFLLVPEHDEDWRYLLKRVDSNKFYAFAYVWNKDDDWCSEFGTIAIKSFGGGIGRIG